ncbi:uncharacterized protein Z520_09545 [Fonsecaea multimorphosa CBS 102226]|uniref:1-alkyl-2-acetylglycerophosphocholine esterase n=1 Tax=Fonsecaea multimorphosa CBS 102226 TaxID=1442371 RepID=A0A0D2GZA0_9EURO|nr:uncharacterized protein Z520_09545 [Fonsecaea multimorphosa CBS 102226]KIX94855.1 hypothetical protein Z520_09545 [Fonsecaea multimorphosa CBS 102226]OAL20432.1 hypothetical protein AYO22_08926 [Fonsecaea multimorphosa]
MMPQLSPIPTLPKPFGPHKVGTTEWEIPVSEIPSPSPTPEPKITTIKFRLFYPTTPKAKSKTSVPWLPTPQREWNQAYASFLGASPRVSSLISLIPMLINMTTIPAVAGAPLLPRDTSSRYPVVVFSHGLGGNFNAYSAVCAALASFGIVCVAPEHRDGSAPISPIRSADGRKSTTIPYQKHPHAPTTKVLNARNAQLRIRLWELEQLFTVLTSFNQGKTFSNYATVLKKSKPGPPLKDALDLRPGHVTWAGHSFGACTTVQFVKSVYYHEFLPSLKGTEFENDLDWRPLYKPADNSELVRQITPDSPVILLDLWAMPLRAGLTKWLWERPLPCYDRRSADGQSHPPTNVVAIISSEFYKWPELLNRMKAALSARPAEAMYTLEKREAARSVKPQQKSQPQLVATPGDKLPPDVREPEVTSRRGFEANRSADLESDDGDELFVTPFATPGEEFPLDKIMTNRRSGFEAWRGGALEAQDVDMDVEREIDEESMREAVRQPLPDSEPEDDDEDVAGSIELGSQLDEEAVADSEIASTSRSSTSSNVTSFSASPSESTSSLSTPASSIQLSRTSSPSPTCDSVSSTTSTSDIDVKGTATSPDAHGQHSDQFDLSFSPFSLLPLDLPKLSVAPNPNTPSPSDPHLYLIPNTAHLSQSDFGVLFPNLTRYLMNAESPVETIRLNVRAMLAVMRNVGLDIESYRDDCAREKKKAQTPPRRDEDEDYDELEELDPILTERCKEERFLRVDIY